MATSNTQIVITAEDKTAAAFATAKAGLEKFTASFSALSGVLGAGITVGGLAASIKSTIDLGDQMNDLSQRVGINVRDLATWKLAADQSGTSIDSVAKGVKGLSKYMVENGDALKKAGITATDANGALIQLSDIFSAMPDGVEKTALAVELFGKSGMDMIPMLNLGSKGLGDASEKAREYGERMAALAPMADKFNDQMAELALQSKVAGINLAVQVVPSLTKFAEQLNEGIRIAGGWTSAIWEFGVLLAPGELPQKLDETREALKALHDEMARGVAQNMSDGGSVDLSGVEKNIGIMNRRKQYLDFMQRQEVMANAAKLGDYRDARDLRRDNSSTMSVAEAMAAAAALRNKGGTSGSAKKAGRPFDPEGDFFYAVEEAQRKRTRAGFDTADKAAQAEAEALERLKQKYINLADPLQKYREQLDEIEKLKQLGRDAGGLDAAQALEAAWRVNDAMDSEIAKLNEVKDAGKNAFADLANAVESWGNKAADTFADFVVDGKASFGDLVNSMLKDIVRLQAKQVLDPITKSASSWLTSAVGNMFGSSSAAGVQLAAGGVMSGPGISAYSGSVVSRPTLFPFAKGIGLMGEAGAEAILPLQRGSNGKLGVQAAGGGGVTVNIIEDSSRAGQTQSRQEQGGALVLDVFVDRIRAAVAGDITRGAGPIPAALAGTYGLNRAAGGY